MAKIMTAAAAARLRPGRERRDFRDAGATGLYLVIQPSGAKSWAMRFRRPNGDPAKMHLGSLDISGRKPSGAPVLGTPITLAEARELAAAVHRQRESGRDPAADRRAAKKRAKHIAADKAANAFAGAADAFVRQYSMRRVRRWPETARLLGLDPRNDLAVIGKGLAHRWSDRAIAEIGVGDVYGIVDEVRRSGVPGLRRRTDEPSDARARAMLSALSRMFGWLVQQRRIEKNPCAGIHRPDAPDSRDRVLDKREIVALWRACDEIGEPVGGVLRLLLLTGCRLREVSEMRREELDGATWLIPGRRTKNGKEHVVPLPPLAVSIIGSVPMIENPDGLVFTITGRPLNHWSKTKRRLDQAMRHQLAQSGELTPWRLHDLRRTFVTGMAEIKIPPHVIEAAVNHVSGAKAGVAGIYNRWTYLDEKRMALARWADHVLGLVEGRKARVLNIRARASK